jgi:hypothetical protein
LMDARYLPIKTSAMLLRPFSTARCRGVAATGLEAFASASVSSSKHTASSNPPKIAWCSDVRPSWSR